MKKVKITYVRLQNESRRTTILISLILDATKRINNAFEMNFSSRSWNNDDLLSDVRHDDNDLKMYSKERDERSEDELNEILGSALAIRRTGQSISAHDKPRYLSEVSWSVLSVDLVDLESRGLKHNPHEVYEVYEYS